MPQRCTSGTRFYKEDHLSRASSDLRPPSQHRSVGSFEIFRALVTKELRVKYKRSVLGFVWSLVTPLALTAVYTFVFVYVHPVGKDGFILFLLTGLLPWQFFSMGLVAATGSFVENAPMVRKVAFPRFLVPLSTVGANLVNLLMGLVVLLPIVLASGRPIWLTLHWLLLAIAMETLLCVALSLALSVCNVYLRDIGQLINIMMIVFFFATPIVYELREVSKFEAIVRANPMTAVMETFHAALFHVGAPDTAVLLQGLGEIILIFMLGVFVFAKLAPAIAKDL